MKYMTQIQLTTHMMVVKKIMPIEMEAYNHERYYEYANNGKVVGWK